MSTEAQERGLDAYAGHAELVETKRIKPALVITRGIPGSGKTTWARDWVSYAPEVRARVNRDDLRANLYGQPAPLPYAQEVAVTAAQREAVRGLLTAGRDVVVDDTHIRAKYIKEWAELAEDCGASFTVADWFAQVPIEMCIQRDLARERTVGEKVIRDMAARLNSAMKQGETTAATGPRYTYTPSYALPTAWVVDIDGTLAHHGGRSPYEWARVSEDRPDWPVINLVDALKRAGHQIVIVSGRDGSCREQTEAWLRAHLGEGAWHQLFMRPEGDSRKDALVKQEIFINEIAGRWCVQGVLDDRNQVVKMWRGMGLLCCQVAPGAF